VADTVSRRWNSIRDASPKRTAIRFGDPSRNPLLPRLLAGLWPAAV